MPLIVSDDVEAAADMLRPFYALYFGGMGAKGKNFHANVAIRMGYESMVDEVQELYLERQEGRGRRRDPVRADRGAVADRARRTRSATTSSAWRESIVTTLLIAGDANTVRQAAEIVLG